MTRCPECRYDHEAEGPGASCLRARTDAELSAECLRRWKVDPRDASARQAREGELARVLNDAFDLLVDVGGVLDGAIAARVLGDLERRARIASHRSCRFLAETVAKYPWLSGKAPFPWERGRCTERESGGVQCELEAGHERLGVKHACPEALRRRFSESRQRTADSSGTMTPGHERSCHCAECAPCKHHPGEDCGCWCRFGSCSPESCPGEADSTQQTADSPDSGSGAVSCELSAARSAQESSSEPPPAAERKPS